MMQAWVGEWLAQRRCSRCFGLRVSETIALQWHHLELDGSSPHVKVRRAIVRGRVGPPKSRHGRREVPLDHALFEEGRNAVQVQRWLGHHSAAFTLATYVHLLDGDIGEPLTMPEGANRVQTWPTPLDATPVAEQRPKIAA
jgi:integrase